MTQQDLVYRLTGLKETEQADLFSWLASQPVPIQKEAMKLFPRARNQLQEKFGLRKAPENQEADYHYALWIICIGKLKSLQTQEFMKRRDTAPNEEDLAKIEQLRLSRIRAEKIAARDKRRGKKSAHYQLKYLLRNNVEGLLKQGASWSEIAAYLKKYHNLDIKSAEYLRQIWKYKIVPELELQQSLLSEKEV